MFCSQMCKKSESYDPIKQQDNDDGDEDGGDDEDDKGHGGEEEEGGAPEGCLKLVYYVCQPIYWVFKITMFDLEDDSKCRHLYPFTFLISMGYIALLSHGIIEVQFRVHDAPPPPPLRIFRAMLAERSRLTCVPNHRPGPPLIDP